MKCVCVERCQVRKTKGGPAILYKAGDVDDFKRCPAHFEKLADRVVDFTTASEGELIDTVWSFASAKKAVKEAYGVTLKNGTKEEVVRNILEIRDRALNLPKDPPKV